MAAQRVSASKADDQSIPPVSWGSSVHTATPSATKTATPFQVMRWSCGSSGALVPAAALTRSRRSSKSAFESAERVAAVAASGCNHGMDSATASAPSTATAAATARSGPTSEEDDARNSATSRSSASSDASTSDAPKSITQTSSPTRHHVRGAEIVVGDPGAVQDLDLRPGGAERGIAEIVDIVQGVAVDRLERGEHAPALVDLTDGEDRRGQHTGGPGALADEGLVLGVLPDGPRRGDVCRLLQAERLPQSEELRCPQLVDRLHLDEHPAAGRRGGHPGTGPAGVGVELVEADDDEA